MAEPSANAAATGITTLDGLLALASALCDGGEGTLGPGDEGAGPRQPSWEPRLRAAALAAELRAGADPLGEAWTRLRPARERRRCGQTLTPPALVTAMVGWGRALDPPPARIVDVGAGTGRFAIAAAQAMPDAEIVAVENDPAIAVLLRANLAVLGLGGRVLVRGDDFTTVTLAPCAGRTLFLGNPPYVRHHGLSREAKDRYADQAAQWGVRATRLAGLHAHFVLHSLKLAGTDDALCFVVAAEWLDVAWGAALRALLPERLGLRSIDRIAVTAAPFRRTQTTAAVITGVIGRPAPHVALRVVGDFGELEALGQGHPVDARILASTAQWSPLFEPPRPARPPEDGAGYRPVGTVGDVFRVSRGGATGANRVWIADPGSPGAALPPELLVPAVTRARELFALDPETGLADTASLRRLVVLPADLGSLNAADRGAVTAFLDWARSQGAHHSYLARHRRPWHALALPLPAPILCSYMARRPPVFVRNHTAARHLNICHGLYPRQPLSAQTLDRIAAWLNRSTGTIGGRVYAGGLVKFEPREVERLPLPALSEMEPG